MKPKKFARPYVDLDLIFKVKALHPETKRMSATALTDWALRLLVASEKVDIALANGDRKA